MGRRKMGKEGKGGNERKEIPDAPKPTLQQ